MRLTTAAAVLPLPRRSLLRRLGHPGLQRAVGLQPTVALPLLLLLLLLLWHSLHQRHPNRAVGVTVMVSEGGPMPYAVSKWTNPAMVAAMTVATMRAPTLLTLTMVVIVMTSAAAVLSMWSHRAAPSMLAMPRRRLHCFPVRCRRSRRPRHGL
jgi:hypothetical protein